MQTQAFRAPGKENIHYSAVMRHWDAQLGIENLAIPDFSRSWDWGSVPVWVAIAVSSIAAWFAFMNLRTAQRALTRNLEIDRGEQARLVYSCSLYQKIIWTGDEIPELPDMFSVFGISGEGAAGIKANMGHPLDGPAIGVMRVGIYNGSNAPIYNPVITLSWEADAFRTESEIRLLDRVVLPKETVEHGIVYALEDPFSSTSYFGSRFSDSLGLKWVQPPLLPIREEVEKINLRTRVSAAYDVARGRKKAL